MAKRAEPAQTPQRVSGMKRPKCECSHIVRAVSENARRECFEFWCGACGHFFRRMTS